MHEQLSVPLIGPEEVARVLGVTVRVVGNMRRSGVIPCVKLTKHRIRFDLPAVLQAIREKQQTGEE